MATNAIGIVGRGEIRLGQRVSISHGVQIIFSRPANLTIGDYCDLGPGVKFVCDGGDVVLGDWTTLHDGCLVLSTEGVRVGQHGWFGQHSVLDGTGGLTIGNGVRVGMYSQLWSHVAAGEQIEGCTLFGRRPVNIEDDVWLVGSCIVASGVSIGRRSVALIGSNITKSWPAHSVVAGSPALRKESLSFYRAIELEEKWRLLSGWLDEISNSLGLQRLECGAAHVFRWTDDTRSDVIAFVRSTAEVEGIVDVFPQATVCCLESKQYRKRVTDLEQRVLKLLASNKARFLSMAPAPTAERSAGK